MTTPDCEEAARPLQGRALDWRACSGHSSLPAPLPGSLLGAGTGHRRGPRTGPTLSKGAGCPSVSEVRPSAHEQKEAGTGGPALRAAAGELAAGWVDFQG